MVVRLRAETLTPYPRFSLHNSPYVAHDRGCAVDLYPDDGDAAPSPVAGEVIDVQSVDAPPRSYAETQDHLVLVDTGKYVARMLHVDPTVASGDHVEQGDSLGRLIRSGFFAPWVAGHIHLGFRRHEANHYRANGSLPIVPGVNVEPADWDGTGTVVETGETYIVLDEPTHPDPDAGRFVGIGDTSAMDGGLPHYDGGGCFGVTDGPVSVLGTTVGRASGDRSCGLSRVDWDDVTVTVDGAAVKGLSLFLTQTQYGAKVVCPGHHFETGETVTVGVDAA